MDLKQACQAKKDKTVDKSWDEINNEFGKPYKTGDSLRNNWEGYEGDVVAEIEGEVERKPKLIDKGD